MSVFHFERYKLADSSFLMKKSGKTKFFSEYLRLVYINVGLRRNWGRNLELESEVSTASLPPIYLQVGQFTFFNIWNTFTLY